MEYIVIGKNKKDNYVQEVFENRGLGKLQISNYLRTTDDVIEEYNGLDNIEEAAKVLNKHIENNNKIIFIVDSDVDGYTSSAIVWNFIDEVYDRYENLYYVNHEGKQHGFALETLEVDWDEYDLVIAPDGGTNDHEQHKLLKEKHNLDIIVLDHHDASAGYSDNAIIVNSQLSKDFKNKMLSGAGISWNFIRCYNDMFLESSYDVDYYLDLVGLGNVADMMSLQELETKHLINKGFENLNNPFFKAAFKKQSYSMDGNLTPTSVSWYIAPLINAVTRVGTQEEKDLMFRAFLERNDGVEVPSNKRGAKPGDTEIISEQAVRVASNVRNRQNRLVDAGMEMLQNKIEEEKLNENKILLLTIDEDALEPEIVGLVANKLASEYQQPTLIGRDLGDSYSGSGRNANYSALEDFRGYIQSTGLLIFSAGHDSAFGWAIKKENLEKFIETTNKELDYLENTKAYRVDFEMDMEEDPREVTEVALDLNELDKLGIWGMDMEEPLVAIKNVVTENITVLGKHKNTIKLESHGIEFMMFFSSADEAEKMKELGLIDVVGRPSVNEWAGRSKPQIIINDYKEVKRTEKDDIDDFMANF